MASLAIAPDLISFNSAILASLHRGAEAVEPWVRRMRQQQLAPDGATFTTLIGEAEGHVARAEAWFATQPVGSSSFFRC